MMAVCQFIRLHINDFSVFTFTPITISVYAVICPFTENIYCPRAWFGFAMHLHEKFTHCCETISDEYIKKFILMTLSNIFVDMICFLYSMIFSVTLMLFRPGCMCVSIDFILMYLSNQLCCWLALDKDKLTVHINRQSRLLIKYHKIAKYSSVIIDLSLTWQKHTK